MKVLLIFPPSIYRNFTPPLNLAYIGAVLEQAGHEVLIVDAAAANSTLTDDGIIQIAQDWQPDTIGLTLNVLFIRPAYNLIKRLRVLGRPIVAGGPHPSLLAEEALRHGVDIVVRGEGEITVVELLNVLASNDTLESVDGISYLHGVKVVHQPPRSLIANLDQLPFPAKHLFDHSLYTLDTPDYQAFGPIFSGRGCPGQCTYCYKGVFGSLVRVRSAKNVIAEMLELNERFGVTAFEFMDDAFSVDMERVSHLCDLILDEFPEPIRWQCTTRLDLTDRSLLLKMKRAGCFRVFYGFESGDRDTLRMVRKRLDIQQAIQVLKWTHDTGMQSIVGFMFGFPWETVTQVNHTTRIIRRISAFVDEFNPLGIMIPVPGTVIYETWSKVSGFQDWWLKDKYGNRYRSNAYFPFFRRRFYNDFSLLEDGFFPFPPHVKRAIRRGTRVIGLHNLYHNNSCLKATILLVLVLLSMTLYRIHPNLEQWLFQKFRTLRHRLADGKLGS